MKHLSVNCLLRIWLNAFGGYGSANQINVNVAAPNAYLRACDLQRIGHECKHTLIVMKNAMLENPDCPECAVLLDQALENQRRL